MNYYNQAIEAIEKVKAALDKDGSYSVEEHIKAIDSLDEALSCLDEVAEVYGISTEEDNEDNS